MIIDTNGNIYQAWFRKDGVIIHDEQNRYGVAFDICLEYTSEQKAKYQAIKEYKQYLAGTDYVAIKFSEGAISEEEYTPIKERRAIARARINELEFDEPTLTREQIDEAERLAMEKLKEGK